MSTSPVQVYRVEFSGNSGVARLNDGDEES
jgi:hypothetical protein